MKTKLLDVTTVIADLALPLSGVMFAAGAAVAVVSGSHSRLAGCWAGIWSPAVVAK